MPSPIVADPAMSSPPFSTTIDPSSTVTPPVCTTTVPSTCTPGAAYVHSSGQLAGMPPPACANTTAQSSSLPSLLSSELVVPTQLAKTFKPPEVIVSPESRIVKPRSIWAPPAAKTEPSWPTANVMSPAAFSNRNGFMAPILKFHCSPATRPDARLTVTPSKSSTETSVVN